MIWGFIKKLRKIKYGDLKSHNIRDYSTDGRGSVDDTPFGGGSGMLLRPDVVASALDKNTKSGEKIIYLSPKGKKFDQRKQDQLSKLKR